jgi:adenine-specific DNA-methyltransferase
MTVSEIRNILESPYNRNVWKGFLQTQFTNNKLNAEDRTISLSDKNLSKQCLSLGNYEINEYTKIGIFEVELNEKVNITRNRVALRNLIKDLTKQVAGAMVVFVQGDKWRFSYVSKRKIKNKDTNEIQDKETAPKRYTYLFGKGEKALTAAQRFDKLVQKQKDNLFDLLALDDFEDAFSVEKLSKDFFKNYKDAYEDFVQFLTGKRFAKKANKYIEQEIHKPDWQLTAIFNKDEKQARDFVKRMMGRIVFLYFIQKKGWLSVKQGKKWGEGNPDYLYDLFKKSKQKDDFYARELVPLFFTRLNNEDSENTARDERFPYLNGGLFDDTQDRKYNKLHLPEDVFERMFNTFNNYNFTIYEDAPDEHTVAVDPEMLGHIFENLLEDNKDKGAFYTPKEIVHYMCKESLKAYLFAQDEKQYADDLAKATIDKIIQQQELNEVETTFAEKNAYKIIDALESVKICDPAIGSGAFPMGLLQEIFNAQIYLQELKGFKKAKTDADIKKHIIEESIYGVDIDAGAVDIARLRFWLSLVVDEQEPQPLPNLDFKIICANTLIPLGELNGLDMEAKASLAVKELEKIRHDFFNVSSESKLNLERQFKKVQNDLLNLRELSTKDNYAFYTKLYGFNPFDFEAAPCSWFDPWWMFGVKDGFDIVIGNPPYINVENLELSTKKHLFENYKTCKGRTDIYVAFIERTLQILKQKGVFTFIIPYPFTNQNYGTLSRQMLIEEFYVKEILDTSEYSVFETATVKNIILTVVKEKHLRKTLIKKVKTKEDFNDNIFSSFSIDQSDFIELKDFRFETKDITRALKLKPIIWNNSIRLDEICLIAYGARLNHKTKSINKEHYVHSEYIEGFKPFTEGKNIERYHYSQYGWLDYQPAEHYNSMFPELFENDKIFFINIVKDKLRFAYDNQNFYNSHTVINCVKWDLLNEVNHITVRKNISNLKIKSAKNYNYLFLLGILNSQLINWYFNSFLSESLHFYPDDAKELPIAKIDSSKQIPFTTLVDYLLYLNDKESRQITTHTANDRIASHIEDVLNMMVYELYFEEHMKSEGIDVLQFISPKPIDDLKNPKDKEEVIQNFYLWYQKPENPVRQRMLLVETRSKEIIAVINKSIQ